jgi:hypothetical protein
MSLQRTLRESWNRDPKLPVSVTSHTVARVSAGFDGCPQLCLSDVECLTGLPDAQALGWHPPLRQACHMAPSQVFPSIRF